jgi:cell wall-associated NlpC family hydrolase
MAGGPVGATRRALIVAALSLVLVTLFGLARAEQAAAAPGKGRPARTVGHGARRPHVRPHRVRREPSRGMRAVQLANHLVGIPYRWGGSSPGAGFDCSGLVQYVFGRMGVSLPHYTVGQYGHGRPVRGRLEPGDLVFFSGLGHVGIYAGKGKFIEAPHSGANVRWSSLAWHRRYDGARRLF